MTQQIEYTSRWAMFRFNGKDVLDSRDPLTASADVMKGCAQPRHPTSMRLLLLLLPAAAHACTCSWTGPLLTVGSASWDNGSQCRPYVVGFSIGTEWIFAVKRMTGDRRGDYSISACGDHWAKVERGMVAGQTDIAESARHRHT